MVRLQRSAARRRHYSHAHLGEALVTRFEATVSATDKALDSGACLSTKEPAPGGTHQPAGPSSRRRSQRA